MISYSDVGPEPLIAITWKVVHCGGCRASVCTDCVLVWSAAERLGSCVKSSVGPASADGLHLI